MDNAEDSAVADFLQILEEHRKNCERQGKYVEAEIAKNRLEELKLHEENRRKVRPSQRRHVFGRSRARAAGQTSGTGRQSAPQRDFAPAPRVSRRRRALPSPQEAMRSRQIAERLGVEEAHMLEFQQVRAGLYAHAGRALLSNPSEELWQWCAPVLSSVACERRDRRDEKAGW